MSKANLDELSRESRNYYERALLKLSGSLFFASMAFMFIGFTAQAGGLSNANNKAESSKLVLITNGGVLSGTSEGQDAETSAASGTGFACFAYIVGFILCSVMSLYMSPFVGSKREAEMLKAPSELEGISTPSSVPIARAVAAPTPTAPSASLYDGYPK
eukprot:CAMPEP_0202964012 /NCGR_PEP_ID=MMETSP1396-20130829/8075_1 /ASSEMBLY_ACC=CAM_ASM_000872 /TAXON_ID= /ORGANISM="Pseudokeronopsis sp., Strain Brazil" /LENGTH=158 /DNA_ID=CAMNT_0049685755 /DNA_START=16 /DNA_END=492 /DNA_ORIENTATION=+